MNKNQTSEDAMKELRDTGEIVILENDIETREFEQIIQKSPTLEDYIKGLKNADYTEFMIGACVTIQLMSQQKAKVTRGWDRFKNALTPSFMKK